MNMFGLPMVGADICGFNGDSTRELCVRWSQLGAFYPLSRNHNTLFGRPQEPTAWGTETTALIREVLLQRYRLLLYLYQLLEQAHSRGHPVVQALFMQFPADTFTHDKDRQFLWGAHLMVVPALEEGARTTWTYFPGSLWYDLWSLEKVSGGREVVEDYPSPLHKINLFGRGGSIIPIVMETPGITPTAESVLASPTIQIYCFLDESGKAVGELFVDDGNTESSTRPVHRVAMVISDKTLTLTPIETQSGDFVKRVVTVKVGGVTGSVTEVYVGKVRQSGVKFDEKTGVLEVDHLVGGSGEDVTTDQQIVITWQ